MSVNDNNEDEEEYDEDEEEYDELLDAEMEYLYEEQGSFDEDALEHIVNAGLIPSAAEEEEWQEGGLDEHATLWSWSIDGVGLRVLVILLWASLARD